MSRDYYSLSKDQSFTIRGTAKLLDIASSRYGGDWHSVPHTHSHTELFFIVSGKGQFLIQDQIFPVDVNNHNVDSQVKLMADIVLRGAENHADVVEGARTVAACCAAIEAAATGKPVKVRNDF